MKKHPEKETLDMPKLSLQQEVALLSRTVHTMLERMNKLEGPEPERKMPDDAQLSARISQLTRAVEDLKLWVIPLQGPARERDRNHTQTLQTTPEDTLKLKKERSEEIAARSYARGRQLAPATLMGDIEEALCSDEELDDGHHEDDLGLYERVMEEFRARLMEAFVAGVEWERD
jgi:hypothetical protein